jgi:pyridinium-3,5-bisthiocarboxylic acid mononucleotide nickel chelatase
VIGWIDGTGGASGDMLLGALVDKGVPIDVLRSAVHAFDLGIDLRVEEVTRAGLGAVRVHVDVPESSTLRHLADVIELLDAVAEPVRTRAVRVFERLAAAEAAVHRIPIDEVHFHEVGALDSVADVVGVCAGFVHLDLEELHASTLSLGSGATRGAHGPIPVPVPAVLAILNGVAPVRAGPAPFEATTPTGAALLAESG